MKRLKHLSSIANDVVARCALELHTSVDQLVGDFEKVWKPGTEGTTYSRKLVEFCSSKALSLLCQNVEGRITDGSFSRFTFDMMLAQEKPGYEDEESSRECIGKGGEDKGRQTKLAPKDDDETPLFYSDIMPLLADHEPSVEEDAFVWLASLVPLAADVVNARFTFETLTAPTGNRLHFPAYDLLLKEIEKCMKHLLKQAKPKGVELVDDEFILHVEGTAGSQRVVRHIKEKSWPGRLTLTNYALYFEASGVISYEDALKIDLSKDVDHTVKAASTGPWGAPLFDKAIVYESPEISESVTLEFPEVTSSTRRDHWLALVREIMLMHRFLSKFKIESTARMWEIHSRTILAIIRLHAAREMLRISPPDPTKFLIFSLFEEVPKGDFVLEELAESLRRIDTSHSCSASSILRNMNLAQLCNTVGQEGEAKGRVVSYSSLETAVNQSLEEAKETDKAKATAVELKEEGTTDSALVLMELVRPLRNSLPWFLQVLNWERPASTVAVITLTLLVVFKEWVGMALAAALLWLVSCMLWARKEKLYEKHNEIIVSAASDQSMAESIVSAQHGLIKLHKMMQEANVAILKVFSIYSSKAYKHANMVMLSMVGLALLIVVIPLKYIIICGVVYHFIMTSRVGKQISNEQNNRRLKEWWDSIPIVQVRVVDK